MYSYKEKILDMSILMRNSLHIEIRNSMFCTHCFATTKNYIKKKGFCSIRNLKVSMFECLAFSGTKNASYHFRYSKRLKLFKFKLSEFNEF